MSFLEQKSNYRWIPFLTLYKKEVKRIQRVLGQTIITPMINSSLYLLIFGVSLGKSIALYHGLPYLAFLIPGLVMMAALNNSFQNASSTITNSRFHGDLFDIKISPLKPFQIVSAYSLGGLTRGLTVCSVTLIMSEIFYYIAMGEVLPIKAPIQLIVFLTIGSFTFACFGLTVGFWAKTFEQINAIGSFVLLPLLYLGGVFFPLGNLHPFWQTVSKFNPMLYYINGVRYGILGVSDVDWMTCLVVSIASLFLMSALATFSVHRGNFGRW